MLTEHMLRHVVVVNVVAPLAVLAGRGFFMRGSSLAGWLGPIAVVQIVLLWGLHLPGGLTFAAAGPASASAAHLSLAAASLLFWVAVFDASGTRVWAALSALLLTAKLSCLLGVLLIFAPRPLYSGYLSSGGVPVAAAIDDQQLAGLLMLSAYTFSYLGAAVVIVARWLSKVDRAPGWRSGPA